MRTAQVNQKKNNFLIPLQFFPRRFLWFTHGISTKTPLYFIFRFSLSPVFPDLMPEAHNFSKQYIHLRKFKCLKLFQQNVFLRTSNWIVSKEVKEGSGG